MHATATLLLYAVLGLCVATAVLLRDDRPGPWRKGVTFVTGVLFWPLYAPLLLARPSGGRAPAAPDFTGRVDTAEEQLLDALSRVEGIAEEVLAPEVARVRALVGQLAAMEKRVREMDELLGTSEFDAASARAALDELRGRGLPDDDARVESVRARLRNIERLASMRDRAREDLERVTLKLEEMSLKLKLLKFAGRSDAEVVHLIKEVAQSVEELTEGLLGAEERPDQASRAI